MIKGYKIGIKTTLVFSIILFLALSSFAADVMTNGTFDSDLSSWTENIVRTNGTRAWDNTVYGVSSGSMRYRTNSGSRQEFRLTDRGTTTTTINSTDQVLLSFYWYKTATDLGTDRHELSVLIVLPSGGTVEVWSDAQEPSGGQVIDGNVTNLDISSSCTETGIYQLELRARIVSIRNSSGYVQANFDDIILDVPVAVNNAPTVIAGATSASVSPVNRYGSNTTTFSTDFNDTDDPGAGTFFVTFRIREPNNSTELTLVNNLQNGAGGLTITDNTGGSYTASYTYNPNDAQTLGLYDFYFEVSDGTDNVVDNYTDNLDELEINETLPPLAPTVTGGATQVSVSPVNRIGAASTIISTDFIDGNEPAVGTFFVTFRIREPNNSTELTLVNNLQHGAGGLTITDNTGGSYTASYTYNPDDAQTLGLYDLFFEVDDGTGTTNAIDNFVGNLDELEINEFIPNNAPTVSAGVTSASVSPVNRYGSNTTTFSTDFNDTDDPGAGAFFVTFRIREPNNSTELTLVNNLQNGAGGLTITDNGGGSYTASYTYNPDDAQTLGLYDLFFEVDDGTGTANSFDDYANNNNELEINEIISNDPPVLTAGVTSASLSPVNRFGAESTVLSATFTDADQPGINAFNITFAVRRPDNSTEDVLVSDVIHGVGGVTITDNGGGSYTAQYTFDPGATQPTGFYDLYFKVRDGLTDAIDNYADNLDELEIVEIFANNQPEVSAGATIVGKSPVSRLDGDNTIISASFYDADIPGVGAFTVTFKIREPNNSTEITLVNALTNGSGGLTIIELGAGSGVYRAEYTYDPDDAQTLGLYDLFFEVTDGSDNAIDNYTDNLDELEINNVLVNNPPSIVAGVTVVSPGSVNRFGGATTTISADFTDPDIPGINAFFVTFKFRAPFSATIYTASDSLAHGVGNMIISDNGGGSYTASFDWNPPDNAILGYMDLYCMITDAEFAATDDFDDNPDELLITNGGENIPPVVPADNTYASPAGVERIGANLTTISATFADGDAPAVSAFRVSFKIRDTANVGEIVLADNAAHGASGVSISDLGGGIYTASVSWDPPDAQALGFYDLYFHVTDQSDTSFDGFSNNSDELEIYDAISNNPPAIVADTTFVLPTSITRVGSEFSMIKTAFTDPDNPGIGAFTITIRVRDEFSTEYDIVNAASHDEQGLRVRHVTGEQYEASVLWDPPGGQITGTYDLYFYVEDNNAASAVDGYTNNADELTVTSTAIAGDGYMLHRTNDADNCGGPNSACHNMPDHQSQSCVVCHTAHSTKNIFLIRETIQTPNSGPKTVEFKTLGVGDPDNDPDPIQGDDTHGAMADDSNLVQTEVCEVCHTNPTKYYRNDDSHTIRKHNNIQNCVESCHPHDNSFAPAAGAESSGGISCNCHSSQFSPMNTSTTSYHHQLSSDSPDYTISSKTCLMCHVDHDIFRPDQNPGFGTRAANLRADTSSTVVQGSSTVLLNSDYQSSGSGGICLSCHVNTQTKGYTQPDGTTQTPAISKSDYDAATSAHNYNAQSTYGDGSTFNANCVKCHTDDMTKTRQTSTVKFGLHDGSYRRILSELGISTPADPLEENFCYQCHSTTSNPNAGSNQDYYGVQSMTNADALDIEAAFTRTYTHPTETYSGRHKPGESASDLDSLNRHAECADCHNPHAAQQGTHDGSSNLVSNALKGTWGVEPVSWPAAPLPSNNANVFAAPTAYVKVEPAVREYQICLKCHSNYTTLPGGSRNLAEEINPNYPSTHGITIANQNPYCNTSTMLEPWASSGITYCSDCHRSSTAGDPEGPHGSNAQYLLVATTVSDDIVGTPLCYVCHSESVYWSGSANNSRFGQHPSSRGAHQKPKGCFTCHMWDYAWTAGLGVQTSENMADGEVFVHGQNKYWNFRDDDSTTGTGQAVDAFCNGYLADVDTTNLSCWTDEDATGCSRSHNNTGY